MRIEFQLTPDTEAPAEMHFYFPDHQLLCLAENCTATMHNVLTLRGAVVRDALGWSRSIDEALDRYGDDVEISIASHSWPRWGRDDVVEHMRRQRDLYRWIHDEAMRLANLGATPDEVAESVELPAPLWNDWSCHGYYGTLSHNVRAVYQRYLGWYDGHPASLEPHPPQAAGRRYVDFMGGMDALLERAQASYDEGDYRWVAQVMRHAVYADPTNAAARSLQADAFEQLGYQAEAGPWRDVYLMGAQELRTGTFDVDFSFRPNIEAASGMTLDQVFDYFAIRLDGPSAVDLGEYEFDWRVDDVDVRVVLSSGTLHGTSQRRARSPVATVRSARSAIDELVATGEPIGTRVADGSIAIEGDASKVISLFDAMDDFGMFFPLIEPGGHAPG